MKRAFLLAVAAWSCETQSSTSLDPAGVAVIAITPVSPTAHAFGTGPTLTATARNQAGVVLPGKTFTWASVNPTVATVVSAAGATTAAEVTATIVGNGSALITASADGISGSTILTVNQVTSQVVVAPAGPLVGYAGQAFQLTATLRDENGFPVAGKTITWQSSTPSVATVSASGAVTVSTAGSTGLTAGADASQTAVALKVRSGPIHFSSISAGDGHTCGIGTDDHNYCWGSNASGRLGASSAIAVVPSPIEIAESIAYQTLSSGAAHSCASTDLFARCWGSNLSGALGTGSRGGSAASPSLVGAPVDFIAITAGEEHTCALSQGHAAWCWGNNPYGQLGVDSLAASGVNAATAVNGSILFATLDAGGAHTCGVAQAGPTYCWGRNLSGELGDGTTTNRSHPVLVGGAATFAAVSVGGHHTCGVTAIGEAYCWGLNDRGQLGDGTTINRTSPVRAASGTLFFSVSAGGAHTCGVTRSSGVIFCWGDNTSGQLGRNLTVGTGTPGPAVSTVAFTSVSAGTKHTCALNSAGGAWCWGRNAEGQLGDATMVDRIVPTLVFGSAAN